MKTPVVARIASVLAVVSMLLRAQPLRDIVPLRHWTAPQYWQPNQTRAEEHAVASAANTTGLPANASPLVFVAMPPCRVVDTRAKSQGFTGAFGPPSLSAGGSRTFPILSNTNCTIPAVARAYSLEITVVPPGPLAYVTAFPTGQSSPVAAVAVQSPQGFLASNTGVIPAGTSGSVEVYASDTTDIVIDINGYYAPQSEITLAGGTAAVPSLSFSGDAGTGIFQSVAGFLNFATGGTNRLTIRSDGDLDLSGNIRQNGTLFLHTLGASSNTGVGISALSNPTNNNNTAVGSLALFSNTAGCCNSAIGYHALWQNTTAGGSVAVGDGALYSNTIGQQNIAVGRLALASTTAGSNNIAIGFGAANNVSGTNSNNIHIGSQGSSNDSGTIRIGTSTPIPGCTFCGPQTAFFVAGVRNRMTGNNDAIPVLIDSNGQLGTVSSSRRYKEDIQDMGEASSALMRLRPVTFRYQKPFADGSKPIQYGLIAEEVAEVYPDLVAHSSDGQIETAKYQVLNSMLLNEVQRQEGVIGEQKDQIRILEDRLCRLEAAMASAVGAAPCSNWNQRLGSSQAMRKRLVSSNKAAHR